jgi:DNA-directed RNA polymerase specialized sigma24 family protein
VAVSGLWKVPGRSVGGRHGTLSGVAAIGSERPDVVAVGRLEREWRRELASPALAAAWACWRQEPPLAGFADPLAAIRFLRAPGSRERKDRILLALLTLARDEPLAGRVVLAALLPGLKAVAGRLLIDASEREELWSLLLAHAWELIRRYPLERRPRHVAANVLLDARKRTVRELRLARRERARAHEAFDRPLLPPRPLSGSADELLELAVRHGVVGRSDAELIARTRLGGEPLVDVAAELSVRYEAARKRRSRAERALTSWLDDRDVRFGASKGPSCRARIRAPAWERAASDPAQANGRAHAQPASDQPAPRSPSRRRLRCARTEPDEWTPRRERPQSKPAVRACQLRAAVTSAGRPPTPPPSRPPSRRHGHDRAPRSGKTWPHARGVSPPGGERDKGDRCR